MLESHYLYVWVDLFCIVFPFLFSFHPKIQFYKQWSNFWIPNLSVALFFIVWDVFFTKIGVWGFNPDYLIGVYVFNLPIEEILFFVCIPYACVFTYYCVLLFFNKLQPSTQTTNYISYLLIALAFLLVSINFNKWYTATTSIFILGLLVYLNIKKVSFLGNFFISYALIIAPFLLSNGILTGSFTLEPVVWYNNNENMGIRAFTIPVEDFFYGMLLLLLNVSLFEVAKNRSIVKK